MSELETLAAEVAECTRCLLHRGRTRSVPGEGPGDAGIMFIGEARAFTRISRDVHLWERRASSSRNCWRASA